MLLLSVLALFIGPLLYHLMRSGGLIARTFDHVIVALLLIVVLVLLLPETFEGLGWMALVLVLAGYLLPGLLETGIKDAAHTFHLLSTLAAMAGLIVHAMLDGAGLAGSAQTNSSSLGLAIVLHRLGLGLVIWMIIQPAFGRRAGWLVLLMMTLATLLGYSLSEWFLPLDGQDTVLIIQALIVGSIMHSLVHRTHTHRPDQTH